MKIVVPGGSGQMGAIVARAFAADGHEVVVLTRGRAPHGRAVPWDGRTLGAWAEEIDGSDVVLNLAGRTVNCRYTENNLREMMASRVESTRVVGQAITAAKRPPAVWLQMSTATIYSHRLDAANDEHTGEIGGHEAGVPAYWARSIEVAKAWEATLATAETPRTRKVILRTAMLMSPDRGGIFDVLLGMVRMGIGGPVGGGKQFVSWIHETDFVAALRFLVAREDVAGVINLAAPNPLPQREFMAGLRAAAGVGFGLPATTWMAEIGAVILRTDTELLLKSRRVVPARLLESGMVFQHPTWAEAARELVTRSRARA